jgi:hypothetical protein
VTNNRRSNSDIHFCFSTGFEHATQACCGYGGPPLNYDGNVPCGHTVSLDGKMVTAKGCSDTTEFVNWDGIHYTEAANFHIASQILTGKYSDPPFVDKMPFVIKPRFWLAYNFPSLLTHFTAPVADTMYTYYLPITIYSLSKKIIYTAWFQLSKRFSFFFSNGLF